MPTSLQGLAQKAASQKGYRFRNLYGMLNEDFLQQSGATSDRMPPLAWIR